MAFSNKQGIVAVTAISLALSACSQETSDSEAPEDTVAEEEISREPSGPRGLLAAGLENPGTIIENMEWIQAVPLPPAFVDPSALWKPDVEIALAKAIAEGEEVERPPNPISFLNSDLGFKGGRVFQGNWHGFNVIDVTQDGAARNVLSVVCPGGIGNISVYENLVFFSVEDERARIDCGADGVEGDSSAERIKGLRIFDISDMSNPRQVAAVQTCRGLHTHTLLPDPNDDRTLYVYGSGLSAPRPSSELARCAADDEAEDEADEQAEDSDAPVNPDTSLYGIDVIRVPLDAPENAEWIGIPRIFADRETGEIDGLWTGGPIEEGAQEAMSTSGCHDITVYPEYNLAAGACLGNGILLDISDPANPARISEISDPNMAIWHSATFSNDASKILFTDEWGGGVAPRCRTGDPLNWGGDLVAEITDDGLVGHGFFKIPAGQPVTENCVAHNGSLVPVPGRDILVQGWYSGGVSVFDFTDSDNPYEIAYFDKGPISDDQIYLAGYFAAYWYNGRIFGSDMVRGLDIFKLLPSEHLSEAEIAAAELIQVDQLNPQTQEVIVWPDRPVVAQAYLDQLQREGAIEDSLAVAVQNAITQWRGSEALVGRLGLAVANASGRNIERLEALTGIFERLG